MTLDLIKLLIPISAVLAFIGYLIILFILVRRVQAQGEE